VQRIRKLSVTVTLDVRDRSITLKDSRDFDKNVQLMILRAGYLKVMQEALAAQPRNIVVQPQVGETPSGLYLPSTQEVAAVTQ
jgi:hypothetical protein